MKILIKLPTRLLLTAILAFGMSAQTFAVMVVEYEGDVDPLTLSNWTQSTGAEPGTLGNEVINSVNYDYLQVEDTSASSAAMYAYDVIPNTIDFSKDWYFEASLRVISNPVELASGVPSHAVIVADGLNYWSFYVADDILGPVDGIGSDVSLSMSQTLTDDYWNDYHTFAIQFSQNGSGTADDLADFYIDGVLIWDDVGRSAMFESNYSYIGFGGISTPGSGGIVNYDYVYFDDGAISVPEPATLALMGLGLAGISFTRKRKA